MATPALPGRPTIPNTRATTPAADTAPRPADADHDRVPTSTDPPRPEPDAGDDAGTPSPDTPPSGDGPGGADPQHPAPVPDDDPDAPVDPAPEPEPAPERPRPEHPVPVPVPRPDEPSPTRPVPAPDTAPAPRPEGGPGAEPRSTTATTAGAAAGDELERRTSATIDAALGAGSAAGGGPGGAGAIARVLQQALQRDANGLTVFDVQELSLEGERRSLERELRRRGAAPDLVQRLMSNIIQQGKVRREREKLEGLLALMVSIGFGNIPKALVNRLVELGLGDEVQRAMREAIGNGRHLSRGAIRDLMSLASGGLGTGTGAMPDVGTAPEHHVEDYYREQDRRTEHQSTATGRARLVRPNGRLDDGVGAAPTDLAAALRGRAAELRW